MGDNHNKADTSAAFYLFRYRLLHNNGPDLPMMSDNCDEAHGNPDREQSDWFPFITLDHGHD